MTGTRHFAIPFGREMLEFDVPRSWAVEVAAAGRLAEDGGASRVLYTGVDAFAEKARTARQAVIVFTDVTRESPDHSLALAALRDLIAAGVPQDRITFLCAVGMHRPSTPEEKSDKLGVEIMARFPVVDHNPADVVRVGQVRDIPVLVNRLLTEPDTLIVALGVVEPHQYAGYSGGSKTVVIGCGGAETIAATHGPRFLRHAGVRLGRIQGNPFQAFMREAGRLVGIDRVYNAVLDTAHTPVLMLAGPPDDVHDSLVPVARQLYEMPVNGLFDVVVAGAGAPKDANLYQLSRAATYIGLSSQPIIRPGGVIILAGPLAEGAGQGQAEQNFIHVLGRSHNLVDMMRWMEETGCQPGEQRAYMIAQLLARHRVIVVGAQQPDVVKQAHFAPVETMDEAFALARVWCGTLHAAPRLLVVPHALQTLPVPAA